MLKQWATEAQAFACGAPTRQQKVGFAKPITSFFRGQLKSSWNPKNAWTFSGLGRALPPPCEQGIEGKSIDQQMKRLLGPDDHFKNDDGRRLLDEITEFVRVRIRKYRRDYERRHGRLQLDQVKLNNSACLENSRAKGGAYEYYRQRVLTVYGEWRAPRRLWNRSVIRVDPRNGKTGIGVGIQDPAVEINFSKLEGIQGAGSGAVPAIDRNWSLSTRVLALNRVVCALAERDFTERLKWDPEDP